MKIARKIFFFSLIIILFIAIGITAFYLWPKSEKKPEEVTTPEEKTNNLGVPADWKIYRSEEYGFEFKYPKEYSINWAIDYQNPESNFYNPNSELVFSLSISSKDDLPFLKVSISKAEYNDIDDWIKDFRKEVEKPYYHEGAEFPPPKIISIEDLIISNIKVKKITEENALFCRTCVMLIAIKNGYFYNFHGSRGEGELTEENRLLVERIFSTFQFLR